MENFNKLYVTFQLISFVFPSFLCIVPLAFMKQTIVSFNVLWYFPVVQSMKFWSTVWTFYLNFENLSGTTRILALSTTSPFSLLQTLQFVEVCLPSSSVLPSQSAPPSSS